MAFPALFDSLKLHLKSRGLTYADIAFALAVSEPTIKRIFSHRDCTMERFAQLCDLAEVDIAELARAAPRPRRLLSKLTRAQEEELIADEKLFLVSVCAMNQMSLDDMVATYALSATDCLSLLLRAEKLGILSMHPNNRIKLNVSRHFAWIPNGPIMRYVAAQAADYFDYPFDGAGEVMRIVNVRISRAASAAMVSRLEQIARESSEQHAADAHLPLAERPLLSVCLAARPWEPMLFRRWLRAADG